MPSVLALDLEAPELELHMHMPPVDQFVRHRGTSVGRIYYWIDCLVNSLIG